MSDGKVIIDTEISTKNFDKQINQIEGRLEEIDIMLKEPKEFGLTETDVAKLTVEAEKLSNKLSELRRKQNDIDGKGFKNFKEDLKDVGNNLTKTVKKVAKWGLAVFGIRSAYNAVRSAMSTISQSDDEVAGKVDYIRNVLAYSLKPVVEWILNATLTLLKYINYLVNAWFGKPLISKETVDNFNKTNKSAQKLSKTLAGFDEMNVLSDSGTGATSGGVNLDFSGLTDIEGIEPPEWLVTIEKIGKWILDNWEQVVGLLLLTKLFFDLLTGNWIGLIFDIIGFVILAIPQIIEACKNLGQSIKEIAIIVWNWIKEKFIDPIALAFSKLWDGLKTGWNNLITSFKNKFEELKNFFGTVKDKIFSIFKDIGTNVGNVISKAFTAVVNGVLGAIESILNTPIKSINGLINTINKVPGINLGTLSTFKLPRLAKGGIVNMPGRGVYRGGAITGEGGPEGQVPLTNDRSLEIIGETIAKHTNFNVTIPVQVGNRLVAREIKRIYAEDNFAFNR